MCGIIAYTGHQASSPILLRGLQQLEYRGYDSVGIALLDKGLHVYKKAGKVRTLAAAIEPLSLPSTVGIGHTRWATHGAPTDANAHPQVSASGRLAIVHNGIIENYNTFKNKLIEKGYCFTSETDTEVLINWIEDIEQEQQCTLAQAVQLALDQVIGTYAIVILDTRLPHTLIAAKKGSPIVIGLGTQAAFVASDIIPLLAYTQQAIFLNDHEIAVITDQQLTIKDSHQVVQTPTIQTLDLAVTAIEKGNFAHFMLKEIVQQPQVMRDCLQGNIGPIPPRLSALQPYLAQLSQAPRIIIVACGTSWHAGLLGEYYLEAFCRIPVEVEYAAEFRYRNPIIHPGDIVLAISQSGETADTLAAIALAHAQGAVTISLCNVATSSLARASHATVCTPAGPEIGVASTKAFTAQLTMLLLMALTIAQQRATLSSQAWQSIRTALATMPDKMTAVLQQAQQAQHIAQQFQQAPNFLYIGRGYHFPIALEGALKLKELAYIHAEGYPAAELKHGALALVDAAMPIVCLAMQDSSYTKMCSHIATLQARKGKIIALITENDQAVSKIADYVLEIPLTHEALLPMLAVIPLQLLAYYSALLRGCNVDQPRNLAKSVTVE